MFTGVLALLERSLRVDSRAWGPHLARFTLMVAIVIAICYASATSSMFGAPGLRFFRSIAYLNLVFMTLMGIGFFSTAITEEKEEDTLGLMLMAGISPLGILLGKSVGRLIQALLLIAVQYPFTLLAVTLGGVTQDQVRSVYVAVFAYMVLLAGAGLLCSTLARRNRTASMRLMIVIAVYLALPSYCGSWMVATSLLPWPYTTIFGWVAESCVFLQISTGDRLEPSSGDKSVPWRPRFRFVLGFVRPCSTRFVFGSDLARIGVSVSQVIPLLFARAAGVARVCLEGFSFCRRGSFGDSDQDRPLCVAVRVDCSHRGTVLRIRQFLRR